MDQVRVFLKELHFDLLLGPQKVLLKAPGMELQRDLLEANSKLLLKEHLIVQLRDPMKKPKWTEKWEQHCCLGLHLARCLVLQLLHIGCNKES
jgi:hypothetical protein